MEKREIYLQAAQKNSCRKIIYRQEKILYFSVVYLTESSSISTSALIVYPNYTFQILYHLCCAPTIKNNFFYRQLMEVMSRLDAVEKDLRDEKTEHKDDVDRLNKNR